MACHHHNQYNLQEKWNNVFLSVSRLPVHFVQYTHRHSWVDCKRRRYCFVIFLFRGKHTLQSSLTLYIGRTHARACAYVESPNMESQFFSCVPVRMLALPEARPDYNALLFISINRLVQSHYQSLTVDFLMLSSVVGT